MCNISLGITEKALKKGWKKGHEEGLHKGRLDMLHDLVKDGLLSLSVTAKKAGMTEEKFRQVTML